MESFESPDSKDATTSSHDTSALEIANLVESSLTISSHGHTSSSGNDQAMATQSRHGKVDEQQLQFDNVDEQQPGSDAAMNPCSSRQVLPNQIANMPNLHVNQQHQQQLLNNDLQPPANEGQQNGLNDKPPQVRPHRPPLNSRRETAMKRPGPPIRQRPRPQVNLCHGVPMNECQRPPVNDQHDQYPQVRQRSPALVSRREVEPGIIEEIYSNKKWRMDRSKIQGVDRCVCKNYVNNNCGNNEMITVIMNTPNLSKRYSLTTSREAQFSELFNAYYGFTRETANTVFVACDRRLREEETPIDINMKNGENIYTFVNASEYYIPKNIQGTPK